MGSSKSLAVAVSTIVLLAGCANQAPVPVEERAQSSQPLAAPAVVEVPPGYYLVKKGDNLLRISLDHGQDYREVAVWNKLEDPNRINVGQLLRVVPPEAVAVARPVTPPPVPSATSEVRPTPVAAADVLKREPKGGTQPYSDAAFAAMKQDGAASPKLAQAPSEVKSAEVKPAATEKAQSTAGVDDIDWGWPGNGKVIAPFNEGNNKGVDLAGKTGDPVVAAATGKVVYAGTGLRGYGNLVIIKHSTTYLSAYAYNSKILVKEGQGVTKGMKIAEVGSSDTDQPKLHFEIRKQGKPVDPVVFLPKR